MRYFASSVVCAAIAALLVLAAARKEYAINRELGVTAIMPSTLSKPAEFPVPVRKSSLEQAEAPRPDPTESASEFAFITVAEPYRGLGPIQAELEHNAARREQARELEDRLRNEPVDRNWAPQMEATIFSVVTSILEDRLSISDLECRASVCNVTLVQTDVYLEMNQAERENYLDRAKRVFSESFLPLLLTPGNRLSELDVVELSAMGGRGGLRFVMHGPAEAAINPRAKLRVDARGL